MSRSSGVAGGGGGTTESLVGNLGATHTFTNAAPATDPHFQGVLNANHTATVACSEGAHLEVGFTQDGTGGRTLAFSGVDTWKTSTGAAPTGLTTTAGSTEFFYFEKLNGTTYGWWLTEPPTGGTADALFYKTMPTGAVAETVARNSRAADSQSITSGRMTLWAIKVAKGKTVNNVTFVTGSTAAVTPTHQWFAIYDKNRNKIAVTADDTTTAWATNTAKTLALSATWTVPADDLYYVGIVVVAGTVPTLASVTVNSAIVGLAPTMGSSADTGLTDPTSAPAICVALTNPQAGIAYAYLS